MTKLWHSRRELAVMLVEVVIMIFLLAALWYFGDSLVWDVFEDGAVGTEEFR